MASFSAKRAVTTVSAGKSWSKFGIGYLFVLPAVVLYLLFVMYPFFASLYFSLTKWNGVDPVKIFVGLANYDRLLQDKVVWIGLQHNLMWMAVGSFVPISLGLFLAMLVWSRPRGFLFFRTVYFMPQVLGTGILGILWSMVYQPRLGLLYEIGDRLGIEFLKFSPLADTRTALWAVLAAAIWAGVGFHFVIMMAGLQGVNMELLDAAEVDGANGMQRFFYVVFPQLSHQVTMVTVLAMIGGLKAFGLIWALTQGGPGHGTETIATRAYVHFLKLSEVGYSAAITMVMAFLALAMTFVFMRIRERGEV